MSEAPKKLQRFHFIDGFRAIAAMMIVLHHSVSNNVMRISAQFGLGFLGELWAHITGSGVNLFFTISGLVLLRPYLRGERKFSTGIYFKKRFLRIYPTYFAAVIFGAAIIWFINTHPTWYNERGIHIYFSYWETFKEALMFNSDGSYYNLAWWSIPVEAIFYIIAPFLIFLFANRDGLHKGRNIVFLLVGTFLGSFILQMVFERYFPNTYSYSHVVLNTGRFLEYPICFLVGLLLAARDFTTKNAYVFLICGAVVYSFVYVYRPFEHSGFGLIYGGLLILSFNSERLQRFLTHPVLLWIGERSYSLFLVHFSVFYFIDNRAALWTTHRGLEYALITRGIGIPLAFLVAMFFFELFEKRFVRGMVTDKMFWPWQISKMRHD